VFSILSVLPCWVEAKVKRSASRVRNLVWRGRPGGLLQSLRRPRFETFECSGDVKWRIRPCHVSRKSKPSGLDELRQLGAVNRQLTGLESCIFDLHQLNCLEKNTLRVYNTLINVHFCAPCSHVYGVVLNVSWKVESVGPTVPKPVPLLIAYTFPVKTAAVMSVITYANDELWNQEWPLGDVIWVRSETNRPVALQAKHVQDSTTLSPVKCFVLCSHPSTKPHYELHTLFVVNLSISTQLNSTQLYW